MHHTHLCIWQMHCFMLPLKWNVFKICLHFSMMTPRERVESMKSHTTQTDRRHKLIQFWQTRANHILNLQTLYWRCPESAARVKLKQRDKENIIGYSAIFFYCTLTNSKIVECVFLFFPQIISSVCCQSSLSLGPHKRGLSIKIKNCLKLFSDERPDQARCSAPLSAAWARYITVLMIVELLICVIAIHLLWLPLSDRQLAHVSRIAAG